MSRFLFIGGTPRRLKGMLLPLSTGEPHIHRCRIMGVHAAIKRERLAVQG